MYVHKLAICHYVLTTFDDLRVKARERCFLQNGPTRREIPRLLDFDDSRNLLGSFLPAIPKGADGLFAQHLVRSIILIGFASIPKFWLRVLG